MSIDLSGTFLKNSAREPVFFGFATFAELFFGVVGANILRTGLETGDATSVRVPRTVPALGDVT